MLCLGFAFLLSLWSLVHRVWYKVISHTIGSEDIRAGWSREGKQVRCTASSGEVADDKQQIEWNVECGIAMQCFLFRWTFKHKLCEQKIRKIIFDLHRCSQVVAMQFWKQRDLYNIEGGNLECKSLSKLKSTENKRKKSGKRN